jgi:hypothetical protein
LLLDLAKLFIPAILSSALITFYFQKRLARIGDFKQITSELMKRLYEGTERVYQKAQETNRDVELLRGVLGKDLIKPDELLSLGKDIYQSSQSFFQTLEEHRIYILSIIPFGGSSVFHSSIMAILGYSEWLVEAMEPGNENKDKHRDLIRKLQDALQRWSSGYNSLRAAIQDSQKRILEGKLP